MFYWIFFLSLSWSEQIEGSAVNVVWLDTVHRWLPRFRLFYRRSDGGTAARRASLRSYAVSICRNHHAPSPPRVRPLISYIPPVHCWVRICYRIGQSWLQYFPRSLHELHAVISPLLPRALPWSWSGETIRQYHQKRAPESITIPYLSVSTWICN
jgi:hypothetical protein